MFRAFATLLFLLAAGCQQQMAQQPSYRPLQPSTLFGDGRSIRAPIAGTVARDEHEDTGKTPIGADDFTRAAGTIGAAPFQPILAAVTWADWSAYREEFPAAVTQAMMERGQERFNIYCSVCHDRVGAGKGAVVARGFTAPPSLHDDWSRGFKLRGIDVKLPRAPVGYYFEVITHGFGAMPEYGTQVAPTDRWAIIAYVRVLQFSQSATLADVPDAAKTRLLRDREGAAMSERISLLAGVVGLALCVVAAVFDVAGCLQSYLCAYFCCLGLALGSLAIGMLQNLTGGAWGLAIRRPLEAATGTLPILALLFVPLALGVGVLYPWAHATPSEELRFQPAYLNVPFFVSRSVIYLIVWTALGFALNRWSLAYDRTGDTAFLEWARGLSGPGLLLYGLTVTFSAIDWVMSLEPNWYSTIFGAMIATGQMLPALALAIAATTYLQRNSEVIWNDLGNLLLAFVMLWTYMAFSQYLLIWSGNLPEEITWYLHRIQGGWQWVGLAVAACYFALPFVLLLSHDIKRDPRRLRRVALVVVVLHVVYTYWLIVPAFSRAQFRVLWTDVPAFVGVGGLWLHAYLRILRVRNATPVRETIVEEAAHA